MSDVYQPPSFDEAMRDMLTAFLVMNPMIAGSAWRLTDRYAPLYGEQALELQQQFAPEYAELYQDLTTAERDRNLEDVSRWVEQLGLIQEAQEGPELTEMRDLLREQVLGELRMGTGLTPEQSREVQQSVRSAEQARGLGAGRGGANREAVQRAIEGMRLQAERQEKAKSLLGTEFQQRSDPFMAILGQPSTVTAAAANAAGSPVGLQQQATAYQSPAMSMLSGSYWNAAQLQMEQDRYMRQLEIAKMNPYLDMGGSASGPVPYRSTSGTTPANATNPARVTYDPNASAWAAGRLP